METTEQAVEIKDTDNLIAFVVKWADSLEVKKVRSYAARYTYVLRCKKTNRVKIGVTDDLETRLKKIRSMSPSELTLSYCFFSEGTELEAFLHRKFDNDRVHGEWFNYTWDMSVFLFYLQNRIERTEENLKAGRAADYKPEPEPDPRDYPSDYGEIFIAAFDHWCKVTVEKNGPLTAEEVIAAVYQLAGSI